MYYTPQLVCKTTNRYVLYYTKHIKYYKQTLENMAASFDLYTESTESRSSLGEAAFPRKCRDPLPDRGAHHRRPRQGALVLRDDL